MTEHDFWEQLRRFFLLYVFKSAEICFRSETQFLRQDFNTNASVLLASSYHCRRVSPRVVQQCVCFLHFFFFCETGSNGSGSAGNLEWDLHGSVRQRRLLTCQLWQLFIVQPKVGFHYKWCSLCSLFPVHLDCSAFYLSSYSDRSCQ